MHDQVLRRSPGPEMLTRALRGPVGGLIARPWFDQMALGTLAKWFFPLSRLWAAARAAGGSTTRFFDEAGVPPGAIALRRLERTLERFEQTRHTVTQCEQRWEDLFFGPGEPPPSVLDQAERERLAIRNSYNALRRLFGPFGLRRMVAPVKWDIPSPEFVEGVYGSAVADPEQMFGVSGQMPAVVESRRIAIGGATHHWIRFPSPAARMADTVIARVYEPHGVSDPPTLIFGHGICVEFDHWRVMVDEIAAMVALGIRVVRPEAPWHGRRVPDGRYGGETFIATAPIGALDLFTSATQEWAVLIDWCRRTTNGPVAIGGSSLGAMTAQLVADKAAYWPPALRPDAMFLVTHCGRIEDAVSEGSLARVWGIARETAAHGWTPALIARYEPLLDPLGTPVMKPENIVTILGRHDDVTPFSSGKALIERWGVPRENAFLWPRGHFSVPIGLMHDHSPLKRFRDVLTRLG